MKLDKILIKSITVTAAILAVQTIISFVFRVSMYNYFLETYFINDNFRYVVNYQALILLILSVFVAIIGYYIVRKQQKLGIALIITMIIVNAVAIYNSNAIDTSVINNSTNAIVIGQGNPHKMVLYARYTCKDCVALSNDISDILKEYIDNHKIELNVKLVDENSILPLSNSGQITYDEYVKYYDQSAELRTMNFDDYKIKLGDSEYQKRIEMVKNNKLEAQQLKVKWVPTFYINNHKYVGHYSKTEFKEIIEKEINNGKIN